MNLMKEPTWSRGLALLAAAVTALAVAHVAFAGNGQVEYYDGWMPLDHQASSFYDRTQGPTCGFRWDNNGMDKSANYWGHVVFVDGSGGWYAGSQGYGIIYVGGNHGINEKPLCRNNHGFGYVARCFANWSDGPLPGEQCV